MRDMPRRVAGWCRRLSREFGAAHAFTDQAQLDWLPWIEPLPEAELTERHFNGLVDRARAKSEYFRLLVRDPEVLVSSVAGLDPPAASTQDLIPGPPGPSAHAKPAVACAPTLKGISLWRGYGKTPSRC